MNHDELIKQGLEFHESFQYEQALAYFEKSFETHPRCAATLYNCANTLHMLGRSSEAERFIRILHEATEEELKKGCSESEIEPRSFQVDAHFLLYFLTLETSGSFQLARPHAVKHILERDDSLDSVWTFDDVVEQLEQDAKNAEQAVPPKSDRAGG